MSVYIYIYVYSGCHKCKLWLMCSGSHMACIFRNWFHIWLMRAERFSDGQCVCLRGVYGLSRKAYMYTYIYLCTYIYIHVL